MGQSTLTCHSDSMRNSFAFFTKLPSTGGDTSRRLHIAPSKSLGPRVWAVMIFASSCNYGALNSASGQASPDDSEGAPENLETGLERVHPVALWVDDSLGAASSCYMAGTFPEN